MQVSMESRKVCAKCTVKRFAGRDFFENSVFHVTYDDLFLKWFVPFCSAQEWAPVVGLVGRVIYPEPARRRVLVFFCVLKVSAEAKNMICRSL